MTRYDFLQFLHVTAAIIWVGAVFTIFMLTLKAERSDDPMEAGRLAEIGKWLTPRLFIPVSVSVLVLGLLLVWDGPWTFDMLWIDIGLAGYAVSFLTGILFLDPEGKRIDAAVREEGPASPRAARYIRRITIVSRIEMAILFAVVADMVIKPTGDDGGVLVGGAVALAVAAVLAYVTAPPAAD